MMFGIFDNKFVDVIDNFNKYVVSSGCFVWFDSILVYYLFFCMNVKFIVKDMEVMINYGEFKFSIIIL